MLAYKNQDGSWTAWAGQTMIVDGEEVILPVTAEQDMSTRELEALGLYVVGQAEEPEGSIRIGATLIDVDGRPYLSLTFAEPQPPVEAEPVRIACALRVSVEDDAVMSVGGSFRVAGMVYLGTGTFLTVFSQPLGSVEPYVIPNNGFSITIAEWGNDYAVLEIRDHAGGSLITPPLFGFSLYQI